MLLYCQDLTNNILFTYKLIDQHFDNAFLSSIIKFKIKQLDFPNLKIDLENLQYLEIPPSDYLIKIELGQNDTIKSINRTKVTGEVFTPQALVHEMLQKLSEDDDKIVLDSKKTYLDNSCGNAAFLAEILKHGVPIKNIYGVDLMADNVSDTVARLAVLQEYGIDIVDENAQFKINHPEYADNHDRAWLEDNHSSFSRRYHGDLDDAEIDVTITFEYFDDGDAGVFRYTFADGVTAINSNIVCQDALTYNYSFSKVRKKVLQF